MAVLMPAFIKAEATMRSLPERSSAEAPSMLNVLLLYEDVDTAVRAKHLIDRLVEHVNMVVSFGLDVCRFDLLPGTARQQAPEDKWLGSDILVLAAHGHGDLSHDTWSWLERWLGLNQDRPRALIMSLDESARNSAVASQVLFFLQTAASRSGVEVFSHFGRNRSADLDSAFESIRYRAETTTALLQDTLQRTGPGTLRDWGIND